MDRHEAYDIVQKLAFTAMNEKTSFEELLLNHPRVNELVDKHKITQIFKTQSYLRYVDDIYLKVFK